MSENRDIHQFATTVLNLPVNGVSTLNIGPATLASLTTDAPGTDGLQLAANKRFSHGYGVDGRYYTCRPRPCENDNADGTEGGLDKDNPGLQQHRRFGRAQIGKHRTAPQRWYILTPFPHFRSDSRAKHGGWARYLRGL